MDQVFPKKYISITHKIKNDDVVGKVSLPKNASDVQKINEYPIPKGSGVIVLEDLGGYNSEWCKVSSIETIEVLDLYVKISDLEPAGQKQFLIADDKIINRPSETAPTLFWYNKEAYVPFKNAKDGTYCVVIESEYNSIISVGQLELMAKKAYYEGIQILLSSKGFEVSNQSITKALEKYYFFGKAQEFYIDPRSCLPVKFLISFPLRCLSKENLTKQPIPKEDTPFTRAKFEIKINPSNFQLKINRLLAALNYYDDSITQYLSPNGIITSFILEYEILNIKRFVKQFLNLTSETENAFKEGENVEYTLGFDESLELQYLLLNDKIIAEQGIINSFRFREPLNTKRTVNFFINADEIIRTYQQLTLQEFFQKFVKYPDPEFKKFDITIDNTVITPEQVENFKKQVDQAKKQCVVFSPAKLASDALSVGRSSQLIAKSIAEQAQIPAESRIKEDLQESIEIIESALNGAVGKGKQDFSSTIKTISSVISVASRVRIIQILMELLICKLGATDDVAGIVRKYGLGLLQALQAYLQLQDLRERESALDLTAEEFITLLGFFGDIELCSPAGAYALRAVQAILQAADQVEQILAFGIPDFFKPKSPTNLYNDLISQMSSTIASLVCQFIVDYLSNLLEEACNDPSSKEPNRRPLANSGLKNPFNSSRNSPLSAGGNDTNGASSADDGSINNDRKSALEDAGLLNEGRDTEVYVDLLKSLLKDLECVLSPVEICSLLTSTPEPETINVIKSIIRRRYLPELQDLLQETQLKILFLELGKRVDPAVCQEINRAFPNNEPSNPTLFCTPQQVEIRKAALDGRAPDEIINQQLDQYNRRISQSIDDTVSAINSNLNKKLDVPLFCGNNNPGLFSPLTPVNKTFAKKRIDSMYAEIYSSFNSDAAGWFDNSIVKEYSVVNSGDPEGDPEEKSSVNVANTKIYFNLYNNLLDRSSFSTSEYQIKNKYVNDQSIQQLMNISPEDLGGEEGKNLIISEINKAKIQNFYELKINTDSVVVQKPFVQFAQFDSNVIPINKTYKNVYTVKKNTSSGITTPLEALSDYLVSSRNSLVSSYSNRSLDDDNYSVFRFDLSGEEKANFDDQEVEDNKFEIRRSINEPITAERIANSLSNNQLNIVLDSILNSKFFSKDLTKEQAYYIYPEAEEQNEILLKFKKSDDYLLQSFTEGPLLAKAFNLARRQTQQQTICDVDPHYLNIKTLKRDILKEYEDRICEDVDQDEVNGRKEPNAFEKTNISSSIVLIFRVYLLDKLIKSLPVFSAFEIKQIFDNDNLVDFYINEIKGDIEKNDKEMYDTFIKYTYETYNYLKSKNKLDKRFVDDDPFRYFVKKELFFAKNKLSRELKTSGLSSGGNPLKIIDYNKFNFDGTESQFRGIIYVEESIQFVEDEDSEAEFLNIPYASFDECRSLNDRYYKPDTKIYLCIRVVYRDESGTKYILQESAVDTLLFFDDFFHFDVTKINNLRTNLRNGFLNDSNFKKLINLFGGDKSIVENLIIYSYYSLIDDPQIKIIFGQSKANALSLLSVLTRDKSYANSGSADDSNSGLTLLKNIAGSQFPAEEIARNPKAASMGALFLLKTLLLTPVQTAKNWATVSDPNIVISKGISDLIQIPFNITWAIFDEEDKKKYAKKAPYPFKFVRDNARVAPVLPFSVAAWIASMPWGNFFMPTVPGFIYWGFDIWDFSYEIYKISNEIDEGTEIAQGQTSGETPTAEATAVACSPQIKDRLEKEVAGEI